LVWNGNEQHKHAELLDFEMILVFQYGSNCSDVRLNGQDRLAGAARVVGHAQTVDDYELQFSVYSSKGKCAAANLVAKPGAMSKVWGVLYELPENRVFGKGNEESGRTLQDIEGGLYSPIKIQVVCDGGQVKEAVTFIAKSVAGLKTSIDYVSHIVSGLKKFTVPDDYITTVKHIAIANNPEIEDDIRKL
jgi:hypothetical protein